MRSTLLPGLLIALCLPATGLANESNLSALLIADDDLRLADVRQKILSTGKIASVTEHNAFQNEVPGLDELQMHDAVLVWAGLNQWGSPKNAALGDVLADYVDGGGGVVIATFGLGSSTGAWTPTGRFTNPTYWALAPQVSQTQGAASLGAILVPGHPILDDVTAFNGGSSSFRVSTSPNPGAILVAGWTDGEPLIATKLVGCVRRVDLNFYPPSNNVSPGFWQAETDGAHIMANALVWVTQSPASPIYCTAGVSASGCQPLISGSGTASATAPSGFVLSTSGGEGAASGLFFFGANGRQANQWGNGTSFQCVVPPVSRATLQSGSGTPGQCNGSFSEDLNAHWTAFPAKNPGAGTFVQAQNWYRDPFSTSNRTTSLSNAIEFCVGP